MEPKASIDTVVTQTDPSLDAAALEQERTSLQVPVNIRSASLVVLAVLACLFTLTWAKAVFIPLALGLLASYALTPIVNRLQRWHVPRVLGSAVLLIAILIGLAWTGYALRDDANDMIESLPNVAQKFREALMKQTGRQATPATAIDKVQQAAAELEKAAEASATAPATPAKRGVTRVQIEKPSFNIKDYFWSGTLGLTVLAGQATMVFFLTFFLLASGTTFRRKMVKIAGTTFSEKKVTVQALDEIAEQIQRYLLVMVFTSLIVAVATWLCFLWLGVDQAGVWGLLAGVLNFIPYIGAIIFTVASAAIGVVQFGNLESAVLIAGASLVVHTLSGYVLTPWLTSRASRMNAVTVFVGVLVWGWLWGIWGFLLGIPILMVVKAVCDRVEDLKPIGELLGS